MVRLIVALIIIVAVLYVFSLGKAGTVPGQGGTVNPGQRRSGNQAVVG